MTRTALGGRVELSTQSLGLAIGDFAMIALFVAVGEIRHGGTLSGGVETFVQFGIGWVLVSVLAGVYRSGAIERPRQAVIQVVAAWVLAAVIGQLIRLMMTPGSFVQLSFVAVSIGFGGAFLAVWRYVAARTVG